MRRKILIIITAVLFAIMLAGLGCELYKELRVTEFSIEDYEDSLFDKPSDIAEPLSCRADAAKAADELWAEYYHKPKGYYQKQVSYDEENDCWMVRGLMWKAYFMQHNPFYGFSGGGAVVIISSEGEALAAWREM